MTLSRMIIRVGIDVIPKEAASACCASVSTLAKTASGCCSEARSKTGANIRHGPHQDAQKSPRARSASAITVSKFSAVSSTVAIVSSSVPPGTIDTLPGMEPRHACNHSRTPTGLPQLAPEGADHAAGEAAPGQRGVICVLGGAHLDVIAAPARPVQPETDPPRTTSAGP